MTYSICHPREIESTAHRLTLQLLRERNNLSLVLDLILSTAASSIKYTRSLALVTKRIIEQLQERGSNMAAQFHEELRDMSLSIFIRHFIEPYEGSASKVHFDYNIVLSVMPLAISAFIGDLTSMGLITFTAFDACMGFLMNRIKTRIHIRCLQHLLQHAGTRHLPQVTESYVRACARMVRERADQHLQYYSLEEDDLRELMEDMVTRPIDSYYREEWDRRLDLEMALQASVLYSVESYRSHSGSPSGSESDSSAHSSSFQVSPQSKASSLTVSPATSVDSTKNADESAMGRAADIVQHPMSVGGILSPCSYTGKASRVTGKNDDTTLTPIIIHAPRPVRPVQFHLQAWLL